MTKISRDKILRKLQNWYAAECDGDWEHQYGIKIDTIDNPGWRVEIELNFTSKRYYELEKNCIQKANW